MPCFFKGTYLFLHPSRGYYTELQKFWSKSLKRCFPEKLQENTLKKKNIIDPSPE